MSFCLLSLLTVKLNELLFWPGRCVMEVVPVPWVSCGIVVRGAAALLVSSSLDMELNGQDCTVHCLSLDFQRLHCWTSQVGALSVPSLFIPSACLVRHPHK